MADMQKSEKLLRSFFPSFYVLTEGFAFLIMTPITVLIVFKAISLEGKDIAVYFLSVAGVIVLSLILSVLTTRRKVMPILRYFRLLLTGDAVPDEIYAEAYRRYLQIPKIHSRDTAMRWIITMGLVIVVLNVFAHPSQTDNFNMVMLLFINSTLSAIVFYLASERLLNNIAAYGVFAKGAEFRAVSRIGRYLSATMISIMAFLVLIMVVVVHNITYYQLVKAYADRMHMATRMVSNRLEGIFEVMIRDARMSVPDRYVIDSLEAVKNERDDTVLTSYLNDHRMFTDAYIAVPGDGTIFTVRSSAIDKGEYQLSFDDSAFTRILSGKTYLGYVGKSSAENMPLVTLAIPIKQEDRVRCILGFVVDRQEMGSCFREGYAHQENIFIIGKDLRVIGASGGTELQRILLERIARKIAADSSRNEFRLLNDRGWERFVLHRGGYNNYIIASIEESKIENDIFKTSFFMVIFLLISLSIVAFFSYKIIRYRVNPLQKIKDAIDRIANGDIAQEIHVTTYDEIGDIISNVVKLLSKLKEIIRNIQDISKGLAVSSEEMSATTVNFSKNALEQAADSEQITATVEEVSAGVDSILGAADNQNDRLNNLVSLMEDLSQIINVINSKTREALTETDRISTWAQSGEEALRDMKNTMDKIIESSGQMTSVIKISNSISDQINLLSLNAAIEAARAGEAGRGFAVVSDEISKLADETAKSIKSIDNLIRDNRGEIEKGMEHITGAIELISTIITGVRSINAMVSEIAGLMQEQLETNMKVNSEASEVNERSHEIKNASQEQRTASGEIVRSISNINNLAQSNAAGSEELSADAGKLSEMAEKLRDAVEYFKT